MRNIINSLIEKVIIPQYGDLSYHVYGTNHFPRSPYPLGFGYIVEFDGISPEIQNDLGKDVKMILEMLGLHHVSYVYNLDFRGVLEVYGIQKDV